MWLRISVIAVSAAGWFALSHVQVTLPAFTVLGLVGWAALMSVIAVIQWRRSREAGREVIRMAGTQRLPGEDTEAFKKLKALRESGYDGPVDQNGDKVTSGRAFDILKALRDRT